METITQYRTAINSDNGKNYWWAYAIYQGKLVIDGAYATEQEAWSFANRRIPVHSNIICLGTKDRYKAGRLIKHQVLEETDNIDLALKRAKHYKRNNE